MDTNTIIYTTGCTSSGVPLIAGVWTLWEQEGFPLEMSHLICQDSGWAVDWAEAMVDASVTNNCPALVKHIEAFLPSETILHLKVGFMHLVRSGRSYESILREKRENGKAFVEFIYAALATR